MFDGLLDEVRSGLSNNEGSQDSTLELDHDAENGEEEVEEDDLFDILNNAVRRLFNITVH